MQIADGMVLLCLSTHCWWQCHMAISYWLSNLTTILSEYIIYIWLINIIININIIIKILLITLKE